MMALVCIRTCLRKETTGIPFSFAFGTCFDRFPCYLKIVWFTVGWIRSLQSVVLDRFHHQSLQTVNSKGLVPKNFAHLPMMGPHEHPYIPNVKNHPGDSK